MQGNSQDRILRYSMSVWWSVAFIIGTVCWALVLIAGAAIIYIVLHFATSAADIEESRRAVLKFAPRMIFWVAMAVATVLFWIQSILEVRRGSVRIRSAGLVVTDWRSRERELPWGSIKGMRVVHSRRPSVTLRTEGKSYQVSTWLQDKQPIIDAVIAGAGLVKVKDNRAWTSYRRAYSDTVEGE